MTYFMTRSNVFPNAFKYDKSKKVIFVKTVEAQVIVLTR